MRKVATRRTRRWVTVAASMVAAVLLALGALTVLGGDEVRADTPARTIDGVVAPLLPPSLPVPEAPPADEYEDVPVTEIGTIEIPAIGLEHPLYSGIWLTVLDVGPGHWPGTAAPGGYGNSVIAGHRVSHSQPFFAIHELEPGDEIVVTTEDGRFVYEVVGDEVVDPIGGMRIVDQEPGYSITIFACHPPGSDAYRYVVHGELVSESLDSRRAARAGTRTGDERAGRDRAA